MIAVGDTVWLGAIVGAVVVAALLLGRSIKAQVGSMAVTVDSVNRAVNNRRPGQPTISDQVARTAARVDDIHVAVETLALSTNRRIADVDRAIDSLDHRLTAHTLANATELAALGLRITAIEVNTTPHPEETAA